MKVMKWILTSAVSFLCGGIVGFLLYEKVKYKGHFEQYQHRLFEDCMKENREHKITLDGYFVRNNYKRIVVYGLGVYHQEFMNDITESYYDSIMLADKSARTLKKDEQKIYGIEDLQKQENYDVIVVTSYNHAAEIEKELREAGISKEIVSYKSLVINATKERQV